MPRCTNIAVYLTLFKTPLTFLLNNVKKYCNFGTARLLRTTLTSHNVFETIFITYQMKNYLDIHIKVALNIAHLIVSIFILYNTNILICICRICISYLSGSLPREKRPTCLAGGAFLVAGELSARTPLTNEIWAALQLAKYSFFWTLFL